MHSFTITCVTVVSVTNVPCDNWRPLQPIFSCHRRLVSHRYRRPTILYVNEDTTGQETFNKYLGILSPSSAYCLSKLYPKPTLQNFVAFLIYVIFFLNSFAIILLPEYLKFANFISLYITIHIFHVSCHESYSHETFRF